MEWRLSECPYNSRTSLARCLPFSGPAIRSPVHGPAHSHPVRHHNLPREEATHQSGEDPLCVHAKDVRMAAVDRSAGPSRKTSHTHAHTYTHTTHSATDIKELEKGIISMVRSENADIKQKQDPARLIINHCQLVVVNTHMPGQHPPCDIKDSPLTQV